MKANRKLLILPAILLLLILMSSALFSGCGPVPPPDVPNVSLGQAITLSQNNNIAQVNVETENGWMTMVTRVEDEPFTIQDMAGNPVIINDGTRLFAHIGNMNAADLQQLGFVFPADFSVTRGNGATDLSLLFLILPLLFFVFLIFFLMRMGQGSARNQIGDIARSKEALKTGEIPRVTFVDVAGVEEAKQDLREVVEFLKHRQKFQRLGARIPKGILLVGPPGTGKTLMARAVAGEAGVPFFSMSGSEFVEIFVGVGASRVRDLFQKAKARSPSIIFIDEIDAVGRRRNVGPGASHEEREQTLNQILAEMDGFSPNIGVIVLAATNRADVLDPALLRPGRFDRRVTLDNPDSMGRRAILEIHSRGKPLDKSVDLNVLARQTSGFSGADLANLVNEAAILAARNNKEVITSEEFAEAADRVIAGPARKSRQVSMIDKKRSAYHEAGHALVAYNLPDADPVFKVSIISRGGIGGYTRTLPEEEHLLMTKPQLQDNLAMLLAGHVAEKAIFGNVSTGPHNDIKRATELAYRMITEFGMGENLSLRTFGGGEPSELGIEQRNYSEETARAIDREIHLLIDNAQKRASEIIIDHRERLVHLAERLIEEENLEGEELKKAFTEPIKGKDAEGQTEGQEEDSLKVKTQNKVKAEVPLGDA